MLTRHACRESDRSLSPGVAKPRVAASSISQKLERKTSCQPYSVTEGRPTHHPTTEIIPQCIQLRTGGRKLLLEHGFEPAIPKHECGSFSLPGHTTDSKETTIPRRSYVEDINDGSCQVEGVNTLDVETRDLMGVSKDGGSPCRMEDSSTFCTGKYCGRDEV